MLNQTTQEIILKVAENSTLPLQLITQNQTNWIQFGVSLFFSSVFVLFLLWGTTKTTLTDLMAKIYCWKYKKITKKHLLVIKHIQSRLFSSDMIQLSTQRKIAEALLKFKGKEFDLLLYTPGGYVFSAIQISKMLLNYPGRIKGIIPMYAMSGGTMLALMCHEIAMMPFASLGPVDPQVGNLFHSGSAAALRKLVNYKKTKVSDNTYIFKHEAAMAERSIKNFLKNNIRISISSTKKEKFINFITNGKIEHSYQLSPRELQQMGINVEILEMNTKLTKIIQKISSLNTTEEVFYV
jgi:ClpP class serine protease